MKGYKNQSAERQYQISKNREWLKKNPNGCKRNKVLKCYRCTAENRWLFIAEERMGLILNPSAVKYSTANNMFPKKGTNRLVLTVKFSGHLPLMQACYLLFPAAGMMSIQTAKDIFAAFSPCPAADEAQQEQWQCSPRSRACSGGTGAGSGLLNWPLKILFRDLQNSLVTN